MDRTVAMCLGQAPTVSVYATSFVKLDLRKPGETNDVQVRDANGATDATAHTFFKASSDLFAILHEILIKIYTPEGKNPSEKTIILPSFNATVVGMEERLSEWQENLPEELRILNQKLGEDGVAYLLPAHFLKQRYLQVCIMLYRPGLAAAILSGNDWSQSTEHALKQSTLLYSARACITRAQEMISLCKQQVNGHSKSLMLTPWWMNVLYAYTAATAIAAATLKKDLIDRLGPFSPNASLEDALNLLTHYSSHRPSARRCLVTLSTIIQPSVADLGHEGNGFEPAAQPLPNQSRDDTPGQAISDAQLGVDLDYNMAFTLRDPHNSVFDFLSDQWLTQPQLDSFDFLGI